MMANFHESDRLALEKVLGDETAAPIVIPLSLLRDITNDLSQDHEIGRGGFGVVYKGVLSNGMVAVKKIPESFDIEEKKFDGEVRCLMEVKHKHIVRFLGYCSEILREMMPYDGRFVWGEVRHSLLCFEYISKGSLDKYLTEASSGLQWTTRFEIIKGICQGVHYLHQHRFIHRDLKPHNILLDDKMMPKIADFGLSRRLSESQSRTITQNNVGTLGYMAREYLISGVITMKADIYSLGVIIIEILTASKERPTVDEVLESWRHTFLASESHILLQQVKVCAEIGITCIDDKPGNRPDIQEIIHRLDETCMSNLCAGSVASTSSAGQLVDELNLMDVSSALSQPKQSALGRFSQLYRQDRKACKPIRISASMAPGETSTELSETEMMDIHPLELYFPFETGKRIECIVNIINRIDRHVNYWIIPQFPDMYNISTNDWGPMCTVAVGVTMLEQLQLPVDAGMFEILMVSMESKDDLADVMASIGNEPIIDADLVNRVEELGGQVHVAMLTAVALLRTERVKCQLSSAPKVVSSKNFWNVRCMDVHPSPTQPWILVGHGKNLCIWDYEKQEIMVQLDVNAQRELMVCSVRFINGKPWFIAGDSTGYIHVYTCLTMHEIVSFKANDDGDGTSAGPVVSLAIHPTCPYLLSACYAGVIKLWDWEMGWTCSRTVQLFEANPTMGQAARVRFNPTDTSTITGCGERCGLKVWRIHSSTDTGSIATMPEVRSTLYDHVFTEDGRNHMVTAYGGIHIRDLQTGTRVHTLRGTMCFYTALACHPTLPLILVGIKTNDPVLTAVYFYNSTNYRLQKVVRCTFDSEVKDFGFVWSTRLVILTGEGIEVLEIDMELLASPQ